MADAHSSYRSPIGETGRTLCALSALASLALLLFAYRKMGGDLFIAWQTNEYSHGIIIPFIALLIAWHRLTHARPRISPSWLGIPALACGGAMLLIAVLAAFPTAAHYGFILSLVGLSLTFLGKAVTRVLLPAFIYLIFAIPLPHLMYANLSQNLQLLSSTLGVMALELFGIPVFQEGNIIDLGGYKLQVVEACSGLRYLFPLVSFGYLIAYLLEDRLWKRAIIFLSTIPITIGMNALRITIIGVTVNWWGPQMAEGLVHDLEGWVIFLFCIALLTAEVWILLGIGKRGHFRFEVFGMAHGRMTSGNARLRPPGVAAVVVLAALAAIFGTSAIDQRSEVIPAHPAFATFPTRLGPWRARQRSLDPEILQGLQLSDYWLADYSPDENATPINFYIAYYDNQRVGSSTHSPSNCIPGGGWQIAEKSIKSIQMPDGEMLSVTRLWIRKGSVGQLVYYWFDERGRNITETYYAKWYLLKDSISMHRTDGALVRLVTQQAKGESEAETEKRLYDFLTVATPAMKQFIPGRVLTSGTMPVNTSNNPLPVE